MKTVNKLDLKWVSDEINESYKGWKAGDSVLLNCQTGTGKSYFIKNTLIPYAKENNMKLLYIHNRVNLGKQISDELDLKSTSNVTLLSYQKITEDILDNQYNISNKACGYSEYDYIVFDECHYILQDASFNNKTRIFAEMFFGEQMPNAVNIYMSATIDKVEHIIKRNCNGKVHEYTTNTDYSYVDAYYFKKLDDIVTTINNDQSGNKWLFFVNSMKTGVELLDQIDDSKFVCSKYNEKYYQHVDQAEVDNIVENNKFDCKCLIATKSLDNGINLHDDKLTNVVIITLDKIDFIQMLGRKRVDIQDAQQVNLYIMEKSKKDFIGKMNIEINKKVELIQEFVSDKNAFNRKYDVDIHKIAKHSDLFYKNQGGEWCINITNRILLHNKECFIKEMIGMLNRDSLAFVKVQVTWLGLKYNESNHIAEIVNDEEVASLANYLDSNVGKKLFAEEQAELTKMIMSDLITINKNIDYRTKTVKPSTLEVIIRNDLNLEYCISKSKRERSIKSVNVNRNYIIITKVI